MQQALRSNKRIFGRPVRFSAALMMTALLVAGCDLMPGTGQDEAAASEGVQHLDVSEFENVTGISRLRDVQNPIKGRYMVQLLLRTQAEPLDDVLGRLNSLYELDIDMVFRNVFYGFAAAMSRDQAEAIAADPDVLYVEQDSYVSAAETELVDGASDGLPWGLDRLGGGLGKYAPAYGGTGVNLYVLSTGVNADATQLNARVGRGINVGYASPWLAGILGTQQPAALLQLLGRKPKAAEKEQTDDCHGHGTRMASIAAGSSLGSAPTANVRPVKILGCDGRGATSGVVQAFEWLYSRYQRPAVLLLPFSGSKSRILDASLRSLLQKDMLAIVADGDSGSDACDVSPSGVRSVLTVAGYGRGEQRPATASGGDCIDLFLPSEAIDSVNAQGARQLTSGSGAAAAYAAGVAAQLREAYVLEDKLSLYRRLASQTVDIQLQIGGESIVAKTLKVPQR